MKLFKYLDYIEHISFGEKIALQSSISNIFLSKAKNYSETLILNFLSQFNQKIEDLSLPVDPVEITRINQKEMKDIIEYICKEVDSTLTPSQVTRYINFFLEKQQEAVEDSLAKNKDHFEEYIKQESESIEYDLRTIDDMIDSKVDPKEFVASLKNKFLNGCQKLIDIPNLSESYKFSTTNFKKLVEDSVFSRVSSLVTSLSYNVLSSNDSGNANDDLQKKIKVFREQSLIDAKSLTDKTQTIKELEENLFKVSNERDRALKDQKSQQIINNNELTLLKDNFTQKEGSLAKSLKEKDMNIYQLEAKIRVLTQDYTDLQNEYTQKVSDLKKDITKLTVDIEFLKSSNGNAISDSKMSTAYSQNIMKNLKEMFSEFKESLDRLDKEKENHFKFKALESIVRDNDVSFNKWKDTIKDLKNEMMASLEKAYDLKLNKLRDESDGLSFKMMKIECLLRDEKEKIELMKKQNEIIQSDYDQIKKLLVQKDILIQSQKDSYKNLELKLNKEEKSVEDLEMRLHKAKVECEMGKDELECVNIVIEDLLVSSGIIYFPSQRINRDSKVM